MLKPLRLSKVAAADVLFTSDLHMHHDRPWIWRDRGFASIADHDEAQIARWNACCGPASHVFHLGDLMARSDCAGFWSLIRRLQFQHLYLLLGNHPSGQKQAYREEVCRRFADLDDLQGGIAAEVYPLNTSIDGDPGRTVTFLPEYVEVTAAKQDLVLCHYPLHSWHGMANGVIHLAGHSHGNHTQPLNRRLDVGVDCFEGPVSLPEVLRLVGKQQPALVDHHGSRDET